MRKFVLALMVGAFVIVTATPALAVDTVGKHCVNIRNGNDTKTVQVCALMEHETTVLHPGWWGIASGSETKGNANKVQVNFIKLWSCFGPVSNQVCHLQEVNDGFTVDFDSPNQEGFYRRTPKAPSSSIEHPNIHTEVRVRVQFGTTWTNWRTVNSKDV